MLTQESFNNGRYVLQHPIGERGGMAEVYLAQDTILDRLVAVKLVRIDRNGHINWQQEVNDFIGEARTLARLDHPRIVTIHDVGLENRGNKVIPYIVMPHYERGSLGGWFKQDRKNKSLRASEVARLLGQAEAALTYAHVNNIIHRDIKATNFLVESHQDSLALPTLVLADFGLALILEGNTRQNSKGTSLYMAPEQWDGGLATPKTDQYQLAIMAFYLLTGRHPFHAGKQPSDQVFKEEMRKLHRYKPSPCPSTYESSIPRRVDQVVSRALAKMPDDRYETVKDFTDAFREASTQTIQLPPPGLFSPERAYNAIKTGDPKWARSIAALVAVLLIIVPILSFVVLESRTSCPSNPFPTTDSSIYSLPAMQTASDCEQIGLSVGTRFFEPPTNDPYRDQKIFIADEIAQGASETAQAQADLSDLITRDPNDAEARIYNEDQLILSQSRPYITIVLGLNFTPDMLGGTHDTLQGAYIAQQKWNSDHRELDELQLLLVIANTGPDANGGNAQHVVSQIVELSKKHTNLVGIVGWDDSTRTIQAIGALGQQPIPLISPTASDETVGGLNFFRIVPPDSSQASLAVNFALNKWPQAKNVAIITTFGNSSTNNYTTSLASSFKQNLENKQVKTGLYGYTFNEPQTVKSALAKALAAKPDLIFFSGYGPDLKTLLEEQSNNSDPKLKTIPIIAGDSASTMNDYNNMSDCNHVSDCRHLPIGLDHTYFTSFASEETNPTADFFKAFRQMFSIPTQVNNVEEATILEYDTLGVLLYGYQYQQNSHNPITLSQALRTMGPYQGLSGQITFGSSNSNPTNKTVALEHVGNNNQLQILDRCGSYQIGDQTSPC